MRLFLIKIQLLLSKRKTKVALCLSALAVSGSILFFAPVGKNQERIYHQSHWNEYVPEIAGAIKSNQALTAAGLKHVYGGIVSHHLPVAIPPLVEFYLRLHSTQPVKNFIIIGPDHTDSGKAPITVSGASFSTAFGEILPIKGLASKLEDSQLARIDESPFELEHSVGSQVLIISKIFPEARVTPIILRSDVTTDHAKALGEMIASLLDPRTVLIVSVDFSHYLTTRQAITLDQISEEVMRNLDLNSLSLLESDSSKAIAAFITAMQKKDAFSTSNIKVLNTNDLMQNSDNTTGYLFGYWGTN